MGVVTALSWFLGSHQLCGPGDVAELPRSGAPDGPGPAQASVWECENLGTWKSVDLGSKKSPKGKFSKSIYVSPKIWARSGSVDPLSGVRHVVNQTLPHVDSASLFDW